MIQLINDEKAVIKYNNRIEECRAEYPDVFKDIKQVDDFKGVFLPWNDFLNSLTEDDFKTYKLVAEEDNDFTGFYLTRQNDNHFIGQLTQYKEDRDYNFMMPLPYGVCDNASQIMEKYDLTGDIIVMLSPVFRCNQPQYGGWRWHKNGSYIGEKEPEFEYLYDETEIELVFVFRLIKVMKKKQSDLD